MVKVFSFPTVPVSGQLFHVPGQAVEGGYTAGAVRLLSPEPGGRSVLEMQIALQLTEWDYPFSSWLMSKGNGEVFRVRLAPTPQVLSAQNPWVTWDNNTLWSDNQPWSGDFSTTFASSALEGNTGIAVNTQALGHRLRPGHVIGHEDRCHIVDEASYNDTFGTTDIVVKPPFRRDIANGDQALLRPFFTGTIGNIEEVRTTYDAANAGMIQPGKIVFSEAIV